MDELVNVSQSARDAAADFYDCPEFRDLSSGCREGLCDHDRDSLPVAFARFERTVRAAVLEEAAGVLDEKAAEWEAKREMYVRAGNNGPYLGSPSYFDSAQAIRQLKDPPMTVEQIEAVARGE